jgi:hypothetical protein
MGISFPSSPDLVPKLYLGMPNALSQKLCFVPRGADQGDGRGSPTAGMGAFPSATWERGNYAELGCRRIDGQMREGQRSSEGHSRVN